MIMHVTLYTINGVVLMTQVLNIYTSLIHGRLLSMLVWYDIGECTVSIININNDIKESTCGYQNCRTCQILIFGGYVKVRESLYTQVIIRVNAIVNHIDTKVFLPRYEGSRMIYQPE